MDEGFILAMPRSDGGMPKMSKAFNGMVFDSWEDADKFRRELQRRHHSMNSLGIFRVLIDVKEACHKAPPQSEAEQEATSVPAS